MVNASLISRLSHAVDLIEERIQQNRPWLGASDDARGRRLLDTVP
jgi:hypothetical protein